MEIYLGVLINEYAGSLYGPDPAVSVFVLLPLFLSGSAFDVAVQKIIQIILNHRPPFNLPQGAIKLGIILTCVCSYTGVIMVIFL